MANPNAPAGMHNTEGQNVDLYIPRKWCVLRAAPLWSPADPPLSCAAQLCDQPTPGRQGQGVRAAEHRARGRCSPPPAEPSAQLTGAGGGEGATSSAGGARAAAALSATRGRSSTRAHHTRGGALVSLSTLSPTRTSPGAGRLPRGAQTTHPPLHAQCRGGGPPSEGALSFHSHSHLSITRRVLAPTHSAVALRRARCLHGQLHHAGTLRVHPLARRV